MSAHTSNRHAEVPDPVVIPWVFRDSVVIRAAQHWYDEMAQAKAMDVWAVRYFGQRDTDHHLCAEQRSQQMRGFIGLKIYRNIYGWCVRDTMNDGMGNMSGNGSLEFAVKWARDYAAAHPGNVEVIAHDDCARVALAKAGL